MTDYEPVDDAELEQMFSVIECYLPIVQRLCRTLQDERKRNWKAAHDALLDLFEREQSDNAELRERVRELEQQQHGSGFPAPKGYVRHD